MVDISHTKIMSKTMDFFGYHGRENAVFFVFGMSGLGKEKIVWLIEHTTLSYYFSAVHRYSQVRLIYLDIPTTKIMFIMIDILAMREEKMQYFSYME